MPGFALLRVLARMELFLRRIAALPADQYFRHYILPANPAGRRRHSVNWGERIVTGVAVVTALLVVAVVALLMGMT